MISDFFRSKHFDFCLIQESMISDSSVQLRLSSDWPGPSFWAPAVSRRGGVVILGSEAFRDRVSVWQRDTDGRVLSLLITIDDIDINSVNVYAPTRPAERRIFLQSHAYLFLSKLSVHCWR